MENKDITNYSREETLTALKKLVGDWLNNGVNRNASVLARGAGVSEACIRRILNNNSLPTTENLQKILVFIKGGGTKGTVLNEIPSSLVGHLKFELDSLSFNELSNFTMMEPFESKLVDWPHRAVFIRSCMPNGIKVNEVKNLFGEYGSTILKNLISDGICSLSNEILKAKDLFENHSFSQNTQKSILSDAVREFYKPDSQTNMISIWTGGVSVSGYSEVMDVIEESNKKILKILQEKQGEIPLFCGGFMDTMTKETVFKVHGGDQ